jgi:hypothetical protein
MELSTGHRIPSLMIAALFALVATTFAPGAAQASRLPSDPLTFVSSPVSLTRMVIEAQAANVWAAVQDIHSR